MMKSPSSTSEADAGFIAVLDAAYSETSAAGACVLIDDFGSPDPVSTGQVSLQQVSSQYEPGAFYKRELPVLLALLDEVKQPLRAVVIDGYVFLDRDGRPGLGAHLAAALGDRVPVIGVAKTPFRGDDWSHRVFRGVSRRPLHVTATGFDPDAAARAVETMHGANRIPEMCKLADRLAREALGASADT